MRASPKMTTAGLLRLKNRLARIQRLLEAEAPPAVLAWECRLIAEAGKMLDPEAYFKRDREEWVHDQRFKLGLCADEGCDEEVATPIHALDVPPLDHTHCAEHASEALLEEDDAPDEGD
jgi:hypothetical protein